jgi:hypothetical protein
MAALQPFAAQAGAATAATPSVTQQPKRLTPPTRPLNGAVFRVGLWWALGQVRAHLARLRE